MIIYDIDENYNYQRIKIGDGVKNVNALPFYNDGFVTEEEAANLYVWKKYSCTENSVSNVTIGSGTSLVYYTKIIINDGKIDIDFSSMKMSITSSFDINVFYNAKGNYVKVADTIYYIPESATITGDSSAVTASSAIKLTIGTEDYLGFISSKLMSSYPTDGGKHTDDYLYEYIGQLGDGNDVNSVNGKTGTVKLTASDVGAVTEEEIPNLYVWKKYSGNPAVYIEKEVINKTISYITSDNHYYAIYYGDNISNENGSIVFVDEYDVFNKTATNSAHGDANILSGKYVCVSMNTPNEKWYYIPSDVLFSFKIENNIKYLWADKAIHITANSNVGEYLGYITSKSFSTYPSSGEHTDGYWYEYYRQLGDAAVVDDSSVNFTETDPTVPAWAKAATKPTYTASEVGALPDTTVIPTKTSDLTNDAGYITSAPVTSVNGMTGEVTIETETDTVKYIEQTLTDEQKLQARANINAAGAIMIVARDYSTQTTVDGVTKIKADHTFEEIKAWHDAGGVVLFRSTALIPVHSISSSKIIFAGIHWHAKEPAFSKVTIDTDGYVITENNTPTITVPGNLAVGQVLSVKSVGANVSQTEWETIDLPTQIQADWSQTDEAAVDFIKNKPTEADALLVAMETGLIEPVVTASSDVLVDKNNTVITL